MLRADLVAPSAGDPGSLAVAYQSPLGKHIHLLGKHTSVFQWDGALERAGHDLDTVHISFQMFSLRSEI